MARHCVAGGCEPRSSDAEAIDHPAFGLEPGATIIAEPAYLLSMRLRRCGCVSFDWEMTMCPHLFTFRFALPKHSKLVREWQRVVGVNADEVRTVLTGAVPVACITGTYCGMARDVAVLTNVTAREVE